MNIHRIHIDISGIVQGVGFRPFVFRLAKEHNLTGWVRNTPAGVEIEVQGISGTLAGFEARLLTEAPPLAFITSVTSRRGAPVVDDDFIILPSADGERLAQVAPDSAVCADCVRELLDPHDRRYRYPFITCTNCGPRYTIVTGIPYDRPLTTMAVFPMCPDCLREYHDPENRRFHAQPIACPACGPQVRLITADGASFPNPPLFLSAGASVREKTDTLEQAIALLKNGSILAVKGLGGYHLAVDACNNTAVMRLRERKMRDEKPFAVMAPDLETAHRLVILNDLEVRLLASPEAPIVIARRKEDCPVSPLTAPGNGWLGVMLPSTPLHHLLFAPEPAFGRPEGEMNPLALRERDRERAYTHAFQALVMTSGNLSDEPIAHKDDDAQQRLAGIADAFLVHDREIHIRTDDSVIRVFRGQPLFYRRSRGYAPRAVALPFEPPSILAVGAELKNTFCLTRGRQAFVSQHIGDLKNIATYEAFRHLISHLRTLLEIEPVLVACDLHPDYLSTGYAEETGLPMVGIQHHHAHLASCMAENGLDGEVIGIVFDGTGLGDNGTIWGGEFLVGGYRNVLRAAHLSPVRLPGGDAAVREPWRMALAYLYEAHGEQVFELDHPIIRQLKEQERGVFAVMLEKGLHAPFTSSCGRLFDAVSALIGLRHTVSYDGQAAIELEALAETAGEETESFSRCTYPFDIMPGMNGAHRIDFSGLILAILDELKAGRPAAVIARQFHFTIAMAAVKTCVRLKTETGHDRVVLSGGVFQNRLLSEMVYTGLSNLGFQVFTHRLLPPGDGGIALGQAVIAGRRTG